MRRLIKPLKTVVIKVENSNQGKSNNFHRYGMFLSGSLLAISESLPFVDIKGNGILHVLKKIREEYKEL